MRPLSPVGAGAGPRPPHRGPGTFSGLTGSILVLGALGLLTLPALIGAAPPAVSNTSSSILANYSTCNPKSVAPSAIHISTPGPSKARAGDQLNISIEFQVVNYSRADKGLLLYFPSLAAVFPQVNGSAIQLFLAPHTLSINGAGWSNASRMAASMSLKFTPTFSPTKLPYLSSSRIAVMANTPTGSLTLEMRWHWTLFHAHKGTTKSSPWTIPASAPNSPDLSSIFFPAAWVGVVYSTGKTAPSGTNYTVGLNGSILSTWFRMVLEYPTNGTEIQSIYENTTATQTVFNATLPLSFRSGTGVPAGNYLIHVHDSCQAIVHILSVGVT